VGVEPRKKTVLRTKMEGGVNPEQERVQERFKVGIRYNKNEEFDLLPSEDYDSSLTEGKGVR